MVAAACLSRRRTARRAPSQLGISHIAAYSPQAGGRSERAFGTLQDRLPKELRLAGITGREAANIAAHNDAFAVTPEHEGTAFVPDRASLAPDILCIQEERQVGNTTLSNGTGAACRSRRPPGGRISCAPRCGFTNIPTAASPCSTAHGGWAATAALARRCRPVGRRHVDAAPCDPHLPKPGAVLAAFKDAARLSAVTDGDP